MTETISDWDTPWKEALERYFAEFLEFFFPWIYQDIDWTKPWEFLDKELQQVVRDTELGRRLADKLVKVWRRNGEEAWVLIHLEIQGQRDRAFPKRMQVYNYRIADRYDRPVASLAVLTDDEANWRPNSYTAELWRCRVSLEFPVVKLLDYEHRWQALEQSHNPFAVVVMAHLKAKATREDPVARLQWKKQLAKGLYRRGYDRTDILELLRFIDWLLVLPTDLELEFSQALHEEEMRMPYITTYERRGMLQGRIQTMQENILEVLDVRFETVPETITEGIQQLDDPELLKTLLRQAIAIASIEAFQALLDRTLAE